MIKGILFDIGGTIFTTDKVEKKNKEKAGLALIKYLQKHGILSSMKKPNGLMIAEQMKTGQKAFKEWAPSHGYIDLSPYDFLSKWVFKNLNKDESNVLRIIANNAINIWKRNGGGFIRPDAAKTLMKLKKLGYRLGIISNTDSLDFVLRRIYDNKIYECFEKDCIYLSAVSQYRKPGKDIFIEACRDLDCKPSEVVYVGDTITRDVIGARNAGMKACIRIKSHTCNEPENPGLKKQDTIYIVDEFKDIANMIKTIK
ncbi:MAG: hypothetical protein Ta2E_06890 [Mycoplasmoidaceae bacterium]|nr:MAG: hypothetical protein Ta2E_06890 [Mycoplasmoidaceae bacterium]